MNPILFSNLLFSNMKPSNLTFLIISSSITTNIYIFYLSMNKWFPLIMTLFFSGGILILFSFFTSIYPSSKSPLLAFSLLWLLQLLMILFMSTKMCNPIYSNIISNSYWYESTSILAISFFLLIFTLNLKHQTLKIGTALKSTK